MSSKYKTCPECNGTGIDEMEASTACWNCGGEGVIERITNRRAKLHQKGRRHALRA